MQSSSETPPTRQPARHEQVRHDAFSERIPDNVLLEPIDYIFADHCRQADLCAALTSFADTLTAPSPDLKETAAALLYGLNVDLSLHIADEEMDLFPRLAARAVVDDHFTELLRVMDAEHERDRILAEQVCDGLACIANGDAPDNLESFRRTMTILAATHLSHLNWENSVLLPLARLRLTTADLTAMGRTMAARRSIPYPGNEV